MFDFGDGVAEIVEVIQIVGHGETGFDGALTDLVHADVGDERRPVEAERKRGVAEGALGRVDAEVLTGGFCDFGREKVIFQVVRSVESFARSDASRWRAAWDFMLNFGGGLTASLSFLLLKTSRSLPGL